VRKATYNLKELHRVKKYSTT